MLTNFIKNNQAFLVLTIIASFIAGFFSLQTIPKEAAPSIDLPFYTVTTTYPGADSETVEKQVTDKLEESFTSISNLNKVESTTRDGMSVINLEFYKSKSETEAVNDIKSEIDSKISSFPDDVEYPIVNRVNSSDRPIYTFSISGPFPTQTIYKKTDLLEDNLNKIQGVSEVNIIGDSNKQINVNINYDKLSSLNLNILSVVSSIRDMFFKAPAGKKNMGGSLYAFEVSNYEDNLNKIINDIKNLEVLNVGGKTIKVSSLGEIINTYTQQSQKNFIVDMKSKEKIGSNSISFSIKRSPGADIESIISKAKSEVENFKSENLNLSTYEIVSQKNIIEDTFETFISNFYQTSIFVLFIILVFIGLRIAIGVSIAFPLVYLITFILFQAFDFTFNNVVSFALVLTLGIMIDNLVVVSESVYLETTRKSNFWEALNTTYKKYGKAVVAGTATTIAIFFPIYFGLTGRMGEFIKFIPLTITITLTVSLFVALILLPLVLKLVTKNVKNSKPSKGAIILDKMANFLAGFEAHIIKNRKRSFGIVVLGWLFFASAISLMATGVIKTGFFGKADTENLYIDVTYKPGLTLEENQNKYTTKILEDVKSYISKNYSGAVKYISVNIGSLSSSSSAGNDKTNFNIKLVEEDKRQEKSYNIQDKLQNYVKTNISSKYGFIKEISFSAQSAGPGGGKPVSFYIVGEDKSKVGSYVEEILVPKMQEQITSLDNITTSIEYTNGKVKYIINQNKAKEYGINMQSISTLVTAIKNSSYEPYGVTLKDLKEFGEDEIPVKMFVNYSGSISNLKIGGIYLDKVLEKKKIQPQISSIQHIDGDMGIQISATKDEGAALSEIMNNIKNIISENPMPSGLSYKAAGDVEQQQESMQGLAISMLVGLFLMFLVLVLLFNSLKYPIIVITSTFLALIGVLYLIAILGKTFSFPAQVGIFGVIGVGVNNAILLIEAYLFSRKDDMNKYDALLNAIKERFPPIFLTTATTIAGLSVLLTDEIWGDLAAAFIGGLLINVVVMIIYLPAIVNLFDRK